MILLIDDRVDKRPVNTLQYILDNAEMGNYFIVYENGDQQICDLPSELLDENGYVKVENGLMLFDVEENEIIASTPQEVFDFCEEYEIFDTKMTCTEEQKKQVFEWFKKYNVIIPEWLL